MRLVLPLLFALAGCRNACQQLCVDVAMYAEECGHTVNQDEVDTCIDSKRTSTIGQEKIQQCAATRDPEKLREWWSCDDLAENWTNLE